MSIHYGAGYVSECCGAPIDPDVGICRRCKEHKEGMYGEDEIETQTIDK